MAIEIITRVGVTCNEGNIASLLAFAVAELGLHPGSELNVLLVDKAEMTELHIEWMHEPGPTDVLSFPMDELRPNSNEEGILSDGSIIDEKNDTENSPMKIKIEELEFSTRTENALISGGIKTLSGLLKKSEGDLKALGGLGDKAIEEIKELLDGKGLALKKEKK